MEIVPNKIHYLIEIREYSGREFGGKSKSEKYCTKVALSRIEQGLIQTLNEGDPDITLTDFNQIDEVLKLIDTKGINIMCIGDKNKAMSMYHPKGKIEALKAAYLKAL